MYDITYSSTPRSDVQCAPVYLRAPGGRIERLVENYMSARWFLAFQSRNNFKFLDAICHFKRSRPPAAFTKQF